MSYFPITVLLTLAVTTNIYAGDVTSGLMEKLKANGKADAVLSMPSIMSSVLSNPMMSLLSGNEKTNFMTGLMKQMTSASQAPFVNALQNLGVKDSQPFWVSNKISMKGVGAPVINALSALPGVFEIREPFRVNLVNPVERGDNSSFSRRSGDAQWGVQRIGACSVWDRTKGDGVLVANIDTGVAADHEALSGNYAGKFHDAYGGRPDDEPYDDGGHGTHTMGTICGQTNGIGVAPDARWVACKGLGNDGGTEVMLSECAQWILDLEEKPVVVSNSWGGGQAGKWYNDEITAWQQAGIVPVFAIGNSGPNCGTANSPGDQPNLISVGATQQSNDIMAKFSSRGPLKGTKTIKPEVAAPGQGILSAWPDGSYQSLSGTSMATPHVAGAVALMKAANPSITYKQIYQKLTSTTDKPNVASGDLKCSGSTNQKYPNNAYGYGRINVAKAMA